MKKIISKVFIPIILGGGAFIGILIVYLFLTVEAKWPVLLLIGYGVVIFIFTKTPFFNNRISCKVRGIYYGLQLANHPKHLVVREGVKFIHPEHITVGENCDIAQGVVFAPLHSHHGALYPSKISIGNNVHFGSHDRIASMNSVVIEDDVLFAAFVHITDHSHEYRDVGLPIRSQGVFSKGPVTIKRGAWLAFGCHVLSGVTVGECAVVAANSVVTKDVPAYSVVAGNPAKVIAEYDFSTNTWIKAKLSQKSV